MNEKGAKREHSPKWRDKNSTKEKKPVKKKRKAQTSRLHDEVKPDPCYACRITGENKFEESNSGKKARKYSIVTSNSSSTKYGFNDKSLCERHEQYEPTELAVKLPRFVIKQIHNLENIPEAKRRDKKGKLTQKGIKPFTKRAVEYILKDKLRNTVTRIFRPSIDVNTGKYWYAPDSETMESNVTKEDISGLSMQETPKLSRLHEKIIKLQVLHNDNQNQLISTIGEIHTSIKENTKEIDNFLNTIITPLKNQEKEYLKEPDLNCYICGLTGITTPASSASNAKYVLEPPEDKASRLPRNEKPLCLKCLEQEETREISCTIQLPDFLIKKIKEDDDVLPGTPKEGARTWIKRSIFTTLESASDRTKKKLIYPKIRGRKQEYWPYTELTYTVAVKSPEVLKKLREQVKELESFRSNQKDELTSLIEEIENTVGENITKMNKLLGTGDELSGLIPRLESKMTMPYAAKNSFISNFGDTN